MPFAPAPFLLFTLGFTQARHQLDQVTGSGSIIELAADQHRPCVLAGTRRARQAEDIGAVGNPGNGARLQRRGANALIGEVAEGFTKAVDDLVEQRRHRFRGAVATGNPGATGGQYHLQGFDRVPPAFRRMAWRRPGLLGRTLRRHRQQ